MQMSQTIGELAKALSKAQGAMRAAAKDRENPFFKSSYATLASVIEAVREPFSTNQLAFVQPTRVDEQGNVVVTTVLMHGSGEWVSGEATAKPTKNDPQGVGSLISYLKRYGLQAMVGVASEDDDGNVASGKSEAARQPPPPPPKQETMTLIYDNNNPAAQRGLVGVLKKQKVSEELWEAIGLGLHGQPKAELENVIAQVIAKAGRI